MGKSKITTGQYFSMLYLSVIVGTIMYMSAAGVKIGETSALLKPVIFAAANILAFIPVWLYLKNEKTKNILESSAEFSKTLSVIFAVIYIAAFFLVLAETAARFDLYISSEVFPETNMAFYIVALVVICAALSLLGIGALSRGAVIFVILVGAAMVYLLINSFGNIDFLNFAPLGTIVGREFSANNLSSCFAAAEAGAVVLYISEIKGKLTKSYLLWILIISASIFVILFALIGALGLYADTQLFPVYSLSVLSSGEAFQRLDKETFFSVSDNWRESFGKIKTNVNAEVTIRRIGEKIV